MCCKAKMLYSNFSRGAKMSLSKLQLSQLLAVYGAMLTDKQRDVVDMYCDCDCSLSEIAEEIGISRQGVRDAILNAEKTLSKLEESLHIAELSKQLSIAVENGDLQQIGEIAKKFVGKE